MSETEKVIEVLSRRSCLVTRIQWESYNRSDVWVKLDLFHLFLFLLLLVAHRSRIWKMNNLFQEINGTRYSFRYFAGKM